MKRRLLLPLLLGPSLLACSLVANLGERTLAKGGQDGGTDDPIDTPTGRSDGGGGTDATGGRPSFCTGITLYATFDTQAAVDVGGATATPAGGVSVATTGGKFGGALSLVRTADAPDDGAALYLGGATTYPANAGSISVWYKTAPGATPDVPVLYRPVGSVPPDDLVTSGLAYYLRNDIDDVFGLHQRTGGEGDGTDQVLAFPVSAGAPYLRDGDYNHYFAAWQNGATPTAFLALNGGLGNAFGDPGDVVYPDAAANGALLVPYRGFTSTAWDPGATPIALRLGGPGTNSPDGLLDDLVVWGRVLSFDEVAAVYAAGKSVGSACGL